jgi:hypothetical protein
MHNIITLHEGLTGQKATCTCQYLLHFFHDLRYEVVVDAPVMDVLDKLVDILIGIQNEVNSTAMPSSNPLLLPSRTDMLLPCAVCGMSGNPYMSLLET